MNNLEIIRAVCTKAKWPAIDLEIYHDDGGPFHLADVLLALEKNLRDRFERQPDADLLANFQEALWLHTKDLIQKGWNLRADDLEQQSPETLAFLAQLFGK